MIRVKGKIKEKEYGLFLHLNCCGFPRIVSRTVMNSLKVLATVYATDWIIEVRKHNCNRR
jgi:hypothetical protein